MGFVEGEELLPLEFLSFFFLKIIFRGVSLSGVIVPFFLICKFVSSILRIRFICFGEGGGISLLEWLLSFLNASSFFFPPLRGL